MSKINENRKGYKKTSVGWIPEDWDLKRIGKLTKTTAGGTPITDKSEYWGGDIKWMNSGELNLKRVYEVKGRITESGLLNSSTKIIPPNCVLIGLAGQGKTRGTIAMNMIPLCINQSIAAIFPSDKLNQDYLYNNLDSRYLELRKLSTGDGGRGGLNLSLINSLFVPLPEIKEQISIAKILSCWDNAIEKTKKLIELKEKRKRYLMQKLLSGKNQLKELNNKWKEYKIGTLGETYNGLTGKTKDDFGKGVPYIPYLNIFNNSKIDLSHMDYVKINNDEKQNKVKYGDVFFTISSETPNEVGMASVLLNEIRELYLNSFCFGFRLYDFKTILPEFSSYFFRASLFRKEVYKLSQGVTRYNISKNQLMKLKIKLPSLNEQITIASILQSADKEIDLLKRKLESLKQQKKGLMQVLLTGKIRVIEK